MCVFGQELKSELERSLESNLRSHEASLRANQELVQRLRIDCDRNKQLRDDLLRKQQTQAAADEDNDAGPGVAAGAKK